MSSFTNTGKDTWVRYQRNGGWGAIFSPQLTQPTPPLVTTEYQVGTHQAAIADQHSRGYISRQLPATGSITPFNRSVAAFAQLDIQHPGASCVWTPTACLFSVTNLPVVRGYTVGASQSSVSFGKTDNIIGYVSGPQPPSSTSVRRNLFVSVAPQQVILAEGYADVYSIPLSTGGGQAIQHDWYADQDWPEPRPSSIETTYTALFLQKPSPFMGPQVLGSLPDPEFLQANSSDVIGPMPSSGTSVPLGPLPQASPQQIDQGYGLVDTLGWSRFPPATIAPDVVPNRPFPQAAPEQTDYLQSNVSDVSGAQPPTAIKSPINRTGWTDPDQKTIASQQAYGALFGARKPPNYFINVKMVPGEDDPEQQSGSAGHGLLWTFVPENGDAFQSTYEFQFGTHQRNVADSHSRGWVVPRTPPTATSVPLGPVDFAAPEQTDHGRASVNRQPPPSGVVRTARPFIFASRIENLESEILTTTEPLVAPPNAPALRPTLFAAPQLIDVTPDVLLQWEPLGGQISAALVASSIYGAPDQIDFGSGVTWGPQPGTATKAFIPQEFYAAQDIPVQGAGTVSTSRLFPTRFLATFTRGYQEFIDSGYALVSQSGLIASPVSQAPYIQAPIALQESVPDYGGASLSKPFLPLQPPALGPAIFASLENRDIRGIAGGIGSIFGGIPATGGAPPITISLFSAPDQRNQADQPSGGFVRVVWQRHVPTTLTAPHMLPLGFGMIRLGGIQMN